MWRFPATLISLVCLSFNMEKGSIEIESLAISVDKYEVTIDEYRDYVSSTDHQSQVFDINHTAFVYSYDSDSWIEESVSGSWLEYMKNTNGDLPVTMVSYTDACTYCQEIGGRLPTEIEWNTYSGSEIIKGNIWHGIFPYRDYGNDGYKNRLSPVGKMTPLSNGLHDIYGNVWEYIQSEENKIVAKGGSYMCDFSMCSDTKGKGHLVLNEERIQPNIGFRCVYDLRAH